MTTAQKPTIAFNQQTSQSVPQHISPDQATRFANELMFADFNMKELELKMWLLTIAPLSGEQIIDPLNEYTYSLEEIADRLGMDKHQAWKKNIALLCDQMSNRTIKVMERYADEEDKQNWIKMPAYSFIRFNGKEKNISLGINAKLFPYLVGITSKFTTIEINEMISISGLMSLKVYLLVKEMIDNDQTTISIQRFKERLGITNTYNDFKELRRVVISPAERQIRKNTCFHHFKFKHDGRSHHPATEITIVISDDPKEIAYQKKARKETVTFVDQLRTLTAEQRTYYENFIRAGIRPEKKAFELVTGYDMEILRSNYAYYCRKAAERSLNNGTPITPGYLVQCIKKDYAKNERETLSAKARAAEKTKAMEDAYLMDDKMADADREYRNKAGAFIKNAPSTVIADLIERFAAEIYTIADNIMGFNFSKDNAIEMVLSGNCKLTTREMKAVREAFAQEIKFGRIDPAKYVDDNRDPRLQEILKRVMKKMNASKK